MSGRDALAAAASAIRRASSVVAGSHRDPDGDAIGSALGLLHALEAAGLAATVTLASGSRCPSTYTFLPGSDRFVAADALTPPDVFIALDAPDLSRLGDAEPLARAASTLIMIDHHPDAIEQGHIHVFDPAAAATGCLVWDLLPHLDVVPDAGIATCLYTALLTDTGRFSYANTSPAALRTAADMVDAGADPSYVYTNAYESRSAAAQRLIGLTLERVTLANHGRVAYSWVTEADFQRTGALPEEGENLIDHVRALGGIDAALLAKVSKGQVRGSLRAKRDADVGSVARALGGGGHRAASGFTFEGSLDDLLARLLPLLPGGHA